MPSPTELQADIRGALRLCIVWVEQATMSIEVFMARAADPTAKIDIEVLGKLVANAGEALDKLDELVERLLAGDASDETQHLLYEGLSKYASPTFWWKQGGKPSQAEKDKGQFARDLLERISPDQSDEEAGE